MPDQTAQRRPVDDRAYAPLTDRAFAAFRWRLATLLARLSPPSRPTPSVPDPAPVSLPLPVIPPSLALVGATPPTPTTVTPPASSPARPLASVAPARTSSTARAVSEFSSVTGIGVGVAALAAERPPGAREALRTGEWVRAGQTA